MDVSSVALAVAMVICAKPVAGGRFSIVSKCFFHVFSFEVMSLRMVTSADIYSLIDRGTFADYKYVFEANIKLA